MYKKMTNLFHSTAKYFAFDPKKYTMEEFFTDLKAFVENFNVIYLYIFPAFLPSVAVCMSVVIFLPTQCFYTR